MQYIKFMRWQDIIIEIGNRNIFGLSKKLDITYAHAYKVTKELEEIGLIRIKKQGRENKITLTGKGKIVSEQMAEIKRIVDGKD